MKEKLAALKQRMLVVEDLKAADAVLRWDQATYMPMGGGEARARQMALLKRLAHERLIDPEVARLLNDLRSYEESLEHESDDASFIRETRRQYELFAKMPPEFYQEWVQLSAESYQVWTRARPDNDFEQVKPYLEKMLRFSRKATEFYKPYDHIADPLIEFYDHEMRVNILKPLFEQLRPKLVDLLQRITAQPQLDRSVLEQEFPSEEQLEFATYIATKIGYDFERGRQDETPHPFMTKFSVGDVRITTRVTGDNIAESLLSTVHEAGHAMYEQGINPEYDGSALGHGASSGAHESQSRLWENIVGRSRGFWNWAFSEFQQRFPEQLAGASADQVYAAMNIVRPSLIRTEADEVTYNLHIMIRFDLELQMLEGKLSVSDLPGAWADRYEADLGIRPPDFRDGLMQDVHWYTGSIGGAFQGYTLGNIMAAQFHAAALRAHPEIPGEIESGEFGTLRGWLAENIYWHGRKFTAEELVKRVTGGSLDIGPYVNYLETKFGELYQL